MKEDFRRICMALRFVIYVVILDFAVLHEFKF